MKRLFSLAGKALLFLYVFLLGAAAGAQNVKTYIPPAAFQLKPVVVEEVYKNFPDLEPKAYIPALIEHESCLSLKHSRCWNTKSQLKTYWNPKETNRINREEGAGLGQLTRAWYKDGRLRFDSLTELKNKHKNQLVDLNWGNIYTRADLQVRAIVLMTRDNYKSLYDVKDNWERLAMADSAYNGGLSGLQKERRLCGLTKGCDPGKWFGHVENTSVKSTEILYGGRSPREINRAHVADTLLVRLPKYRAWYTEAEKDFNTLNNR